MKSGIDVADHADHAEHVMIRGHVFKWADKAPFVRSELSIFGAVEYDFQRDRLRCHECAEWFAGLGHHIASGAHGMTLPEYKRRHGLRLRASLVSREMSDKRGSVSVLKRTGNIESLAALPGFTNKRTAPTRDHSERRNEEGRCAAQISLQIHVIAKKMGRTPTTDELKQDGLGISKILASFKASSLSEVMEKIGLEPRGPGIRPDYQEIEWL